MYKFKNMLVILLIFLISFCINSKAFANTIEKPNIEVYNVDKSVFFNDEKTYLSSEQIKTDSYNPYLLLLSIVIPGLGQMLNGDIWGLKFPIMIAVLILSAVTFSYSISSGDKDGIGSGLLIFYLVMPLTITLLLVIYIWNLFDAYFLYEKNKNTDNEEKYQRKRTLSHLETLEQKISIAQNGLKFNLYSF